MKHLKSLMAGMAALSLGLAACTSEDPEMATVMDSGTNEGSNDAIYSSIRFHLPASRSTVKEGEEVGQDYENKVGSILVVLATKEGDNYSYLTYALSDASVSAPGNDATRHTVVFQEKENLISQAGKSVYVFAYCNPTEAIRSAITNPGSDKNAFFDAICNGDYESTWSANGFLMTNVQVLEKTLPGEDEIKTYNSASNALDLGTVDVIRSAVRFDYKDGSPKQADKTPKFGVNTYAIYDAQVIDPTDNDVVAKVHMTNVALVNMRNEFYYLPRTSDKGLCPGLTGMETTAIDSYVVTPADATYAYGLPAAIYHGDEAYKSLDWTSLDAIVSGTADVDEGWGENIADKEGYYIWRYATENSTNGSTELSINSTTGAIFEAEIIFDGDNTPENGATVYLFGNTIYTSIAAIQEDIKKAPISNLATAYSKAFTVNESDNSVVPISDEAVEAAGFTAYKPATDGKYYCYYFYFNRHNDDENPTTTGVMEFATVRNNVYKLSVTGVKKLGGFKPDEKVEDWDAYFSLNVAVKPWVVRVNNIEF